MIVVQIVINIRGNDNNSIEINTLEREDANDLERELARNFEELHHSILGEIRDQLPEGDAEITVIGDEAYRGAA